VFDDAVGLCVVHKGEDRLSADGTAECSEVLAVKLFAIVDGEFGRDSEAADNVIVETALASIHFVKYSTAKKVNLRFP
jgi:hypothetical protein